MAADPEEEKTQPPPAAVEFEPPLACVRRILKHTLPSSTNVGKDASAAFARASGIFIIYLTACANDFARTHKRQTITANDVLAAIKELDFDDFSTDMMSFLESYRVSEKHKKDAKAKAAADKKERDDDGSKETPSKQEDEENDDDDDDNDNEAKDDDDDDDEENSDRKRHRNDDDDNTAAESPKHSPETESVEEPTLKKAKLGENVNAKDDTETGGKAGTGADEDETAE